MWPPNPNEPLTLENEMTATNEARKVARIFQEPTGKYHVCDDSLSMLDARGRGYDTKAEAMAAASRNGYTHARGSGTYRGNKLTKLAPQS